VPLTTPHNIDVFEIQGQSLPGQGQSAEQALPR
jgi:hypothetical protein